MRLQPYALAAIASASCFLAGCGTANARHAAPARPAAFTRPAPNELLRSAFTYADDWWARQGTVPPCPGDAQVTITATDGEHGGFGYYGSCDVEINAVWWGTASRVLTSGTRRGRRIMLEQLCVLAIHERGHNIGYGHTATGVMRAELDSMPGGCVLWAARMTPRR